MRFFHLEHQDQVIWLRVCSGVCTAYEFFAIWKKLCNMAAAVV